MSWKFESFFVWGNNTYAQKYIQSRQYGLTCALCQLYTSKAVKIVQLTAQLHLEILMQARPYTQAGNIICKDWVIHPFLKAITLNACEIPQGVHYPTWGMDLSVGWKRGTSTVENPIHWNLHQNVVCLHAGKASKGGPDSNPEIGVTSGAAVNLGSLSKPRPLVKQQLSSLQILLLPWSNAFKMLWWMPSPHPCLQFNSDRSSS